MSSHAYSLFERHDGLSFAYKVLGRNQHATPLVMVHGCVVRGSLSGQLPHLIVLCLSQTERSGID